MSTLYETSREAWLEQQFRGLLTALATRENLLPICVNSICQAGPVPHMAMDGLEHPVRREDL